jgi:membrane protease YdiL (CAAX protease family)
VALKIAVIVGHGLAGTLGVPHLGQRFLKAALLSALALSLIYLLRRRGDRRPWRELWLWPVLGRLRYLLLGIGLALAAAAVVFGAGVAAGWMHFGGINASSAVLAGLLIDIPIAFLFEPLPEETVFRGYLYANLATRLPRWAALSAQVALFVAEAVCARLLVGAAAGGGGRSGST